VSRMAVSADFRCRRKSPRCSRRRRKSSVVAITVRLDRRPWSPRRGAAARKQPEHDRSRRRVTGPSRCFSFDVRDCPSRPVRNCGWCRHESRCRSVPRAGWAREDATGVPRPMIHTSLGPPSVVGCQRTSNGGVKPRRLMNAGGPPVPELLNAAQDVIVPSADTSPEELKSNC